MPKELIQTRAPDELVSDIEDYQEREGHLNRAEAIRALLRAGLRTETRDETDDGSSSDTPGLDPDDPNVTELHALDGPLHIALAGIIGISLLFVIALELGAPVDATTIVTGLTAFVSAFAGASAAIPTDS